MIIDYPQKKFYFKPNENFNNRYAYNVAGIEIIQISPNINLVEVLDVWANSPAAIAGVQKGDQIFEINGSIAFDMTMGEIRKLFETPSKRPLRMTLMRNNKQFMVVIDMKDKI